VGKTGMDNEAGNKPLLWSNLVVWIAYAPL
jgi:hypothetical protein